MVDFQTVFEKLDRVLEELEQFAKSVLIALAVV